MAPSTGNPAQRMKKKPPPRIVPVVPLPFSRPNHSPRPITPEETVTEPKDGQQPRQSAPQVIEEVSRPSGPLTPDSKASAPSPRQDQPPTPETSELQNDVSEQHLDAKKQSSTSSTRDGEGPAHVPPPQPSSPSTANGIEIPVRLAEQHTTQPHVPDRSSGPAALLPAHRPHPSVESIVFGASAQSPSISPPPQEIEAQMHTHQQHVTRPPPGFAAPQYGFTNFVPGHAHHPSNSNTPFPYPPMSLPPPPPNGPFGYGPAVAWSHPQAHAPFQPPRFSPFPQAAYMNGSEHAHMSRAQSPTKSHPSDTRAGSEYEHDVEGRMSLMPPPSKDMSVDHMSLEPVPFRLARYVISQFGQPDFADFELQIRTGDSIYLRGLPVHGVIVSQSPVIASAIRAASPRSTGLPLVDIAATYKFVNAHPVVDALKHLYGAPFEISDRATMNKPFYEPYAPGSDAPNPSQDIMALALSYVAAGILLQLPAFIEHSIEFVRKSIRYDTLDQVLRFAFQDLHDSHVQNVLVSVAFDFLASEFPVEFKLYIGGTELSGTSKGPKHNPRLSKIRFGDVPAEEEAVPDVVTQIISRILLGLPFPHLEHFFTHPRLRKRLGWKVDDIRHAVLNERQES